MKIVHQKQPTQSSCTHTCLAMLLGVPARKVIDRFGHPDGLSQSQLFTALDACKFEWDALLVGRLLFDGFYIAGVPSLNDRAGGHSVLFEMRRNTLTVYDPQRGNPGKKFYVGEREMGVQVKWWSELVCVVPPGRLPRKKP